MTDFEKLNHSTSHLMAEAISHLYPNAKFGFGPAIEEGFYYDVDFGDVQITDADFPAIEAEMRKIAAKNAKFERIEVSKEEAKKLFKDNPYKLELIEGIEDQITVYKQGEWFDLCAGPHVESTGKIQNFKLLNIAGAYWRGDSKNKQLVRIYGTSWPSKKELDNYLKVLEERKARDHRKLGKDLGLFMISEYGPGFPFFLPKGMILRNELENFWYKIHEENGYVFVKTPIMMDVDLWKISGHYYHYKENMFFSSIDEKEYAIKPMNCPGSILVYKNDLHSFRDLPIRMGELGHVHRYEASGALAGLFRVRAFTQDDAHVFCTLDQLEDEIIKMLALFDKIYSIFNLSYHIELSTRPEKGSIGDEEVWRRSEEILAKVCQKSGREFKVNPGDGAFYGPKLDFKLRDSMNRIWQCGTIQLDMNLPERFDVTYIDSNGEKQRPVMLHRAIFGSIERFIGIITEHFGGAFPLWLSPEHVRVLPVNNEFHLEKAKEIVDVLKKNGIRASLDANEDKLGYRMRNSQVNKVPYTVVVGDHERDEGTVTYRHFGCKAQHTVKLDEFIKLLKEEIETKALPKYEEEQN